MLARSFHMARSVETAAGHAAGQRTAGGEAKE